MKKNSRRILGIGGVIVGILAISFVYFLIFQAHSNNKNFFIHDIETISGDIEEVNEDRLVIVDRNGNKFEIYSQESVTDPNYKPTKEVNFDDLQPGQNVFTYSKLIEGKLIIVNLSAR